MRERDGGKDEREEEDKQKEEREGGIQSNSDLKTAYFIQSHI